MNVLNLKNEMIYYKPADKKLSLMKKLSSLGYKFSDNCILNHNSIGYNKITNSFTTVLNFLAENDHKTTSWWENKIKSHYDRLKSYDETDTYLDEQIKNLKK